MAKREEDTEEMVDVYEYINRPIGERLIDAEQFGNEEVEDE
jgi:hypothetical protein